MLNEQLVAYWQGCPRSLSRVPTDEIQMLAGIDSDIYGEHNGRICQNAPSNFVGALILGALREELLPEMVALGLRPPRSLSEPFCLLSDVSLASYNNIRHSYDDIGARVDKVLFNRAYMYDTGLVTAGPFAGLILEVADGLPPGQTMCINRVFNDGLIDKVVKPYPAATTGCLGCSAEREPERYANLRPFLDGTYLVNRYYQLYRQLQIELEDRGQVYLSDMLFYLADVLRLPLDREQFHYTREY